MTTGACNFKQGDHLTVLILFLNLSQEKNVLNEDVDQSTGWWDGNCHCLKPYQPQKARLIWPGVYSSFISGARTVDVYWRSQLSETQVAPPSPWKWDGDREWSGRCPLLLAPGLWVKASFVWVLTHDPQKSCLWFSCRCQDRWKIF